MRNDWLSQLTELIDGFIECEWMSPPSLNGGIWNYDAAEATLYCKRLGFLNYFTHYYSDSDSSFTVVASVWLEAHFLIFTLSSFLLFFELRISNIIYSLLFESNLFLSAFSWTNDNYDDGNAWDDGPVPRWKGMWLTVWLIDWWQNVWCFEFVLWLLFPFLWLCG